MAYTCVYVHVFCGLITDIGLQMGTVCHFKLTNVGATTSELVKTVVLLSFVGDFRADKLTELVVWL